MAQTPTRIKTSKPGPKGLSEADYIEAMRKHACDRYLTALELGVSPEAVYQRIKGSKRLERFVEEFEGRVIGAAKSVIMHAIVTKKSERWAAWWLERKADGFARRTELTGPNGGSIPVEMHVTVEYVTATPEPEDEEVPV